MSIQIVRIPGVTKFVDKRKTLKKHPTEKYSLRNLSRVNSIALHHSLTYSGTAEAFANHHVTTDGWPGIGYHFVIQRDGEVSWCNDLEIKSYHVGDSNAKAIGICFVGDFRTQEPTVEQLNASFALIKYLQQVVPTATQILGHSQYPGYERKECPAIDMDVFRKSYAKYVQSSQQKTSKPAPTPQPAEPAKTECGIKVNGQALAVKGLLIDGKSFVPVRAVGEKVKATVGWCNSQHVAMINQIRLMTTQVIGTTGYAHSVEVAKSLGYQVKWDAACSTVEIFK